MTVIFFFINKNFQSSAILPHLLIKTNPTERYCVCVSEIGVFHKELFDATVRPSRKVSRKRILRGNYAMYVAVTGVYVAT